MATPTELLNTIESFTTAADSIIIQRDVASSGMQYTLPNLTANTRVRFTGEAYGVEVYLGAVDDNHGFNLTTGYTTAAGSINGLFVYSGKHDGHSFYKEAGGTGVIRWGGTSVGWIYEPTFCAASSARYLRSGRTTATHPQDVTTWTKGTSITNSNQTVTFQDAPIANINRWVDIVPRYKLSVIAGAGKTGIKINSQTDALTPGTETYVGWIVNKKIPYSKPSGTTILPRYKTLDGETASNLRLRFTGGCGTNIDTATWGHIYLSTLPSIREVVITL